MKYGVEVVVLQYAYEELEADCPAEAEHIAEQKAQNGELDFHEIFCRVVFPKISLMNLYRKSS